MEAASGANQLGLMFICWKKDETRRILREFSPCETLLFFRSVALRVLFSAASAAWPASSPPTDAASENRRCDMKDRSRRNSEPALT